MKLNKIFMALAATALVACSNEDLSDFSANQAPEQDSRLIELDENFAIAGVGVEDATTRTHWDAAPSGALVNKFLPIYAAVPGGGTLDNYFDLNEEAVGLCWLGQTPDENVYTNYQFYHFGWLNNGETEANIECDALLNGSLYTDVTVANNGQAVGDEADPADFTLPAKSAIGLNYNSGVYKTDNKSIFGGTYIVYYPFDATFENAGTIPAKAETMFNPVSQAYNTKEIGRATFRYSSPVEIKGGAKASDFGLYNLSSLVQLRVACPVGDGAIGDNIDQIVLYSPSQKLLKQANLAADKIVAGQKGAGLYASTEGTKTIVANFAAPVALAATTGAVTSAYITVLPTTVEDLKVLVHNSTDGTWATVALPNTVFEAGKAKRLDVTVANADFTADYIAVDHASLVQAVTEANNAATTTATNHATVTVIGDITLTGDPLIETGTFAKSLWIDITGDDIIVPENVTFTAETNMLSSIRVLGKSCCSNGAWTGGRLTINGGTISNVTMEPTEANATTPALYDQYNPEVTYSAAATIAAGKTVNVEAGNVFVNAGTIKHKGDIKIAQGAKLTVSGTGDLNFMGSTVVNDGTIEVEKNGKYDMTDSDGNATATDGQRMTNNGKFIHNVDAGVGTAVQSMKQNGEYRCKVDDQIKLDDAFLQWTACSVIEMVNAGKNYDLGNACKHNDKYIDIEVSTTSGTAFINPTPDNKEINIGKLTVKSTFGIDFTNTVGTTTGKRTLTVNGDMTVKGNTSIKDSKKINIKQNLTVDGAWINYGGGKWADGSLKNEGLAVTGDITVSGAGLFAADEIDALNITCANFYLKSGATAEFGNRTNGDAKNMTVNGTISNPVGCKFDIKAAAGANVLAWVSCKELKVGGTWGAARPRVE